MRRSSVRSAINGQVRPGDVGSIWTCDKCDQRRDFVDMPIAAQCRSGDLRRRPVTGSWIQIGVDGARLDIIDGNAPLSHLPGQSLGKHFDGPFSRGIGHQPGRHHPLARRQAPRHPAHPRARSQRSLGRRRSQNAVHLRQHQRLPCPPFHPRRTDRSEQVNPTSSAHRRG